MAFLALLSCLRWRHTCGHRATFWPGRCRTCETKPQTPLTNPPAPPSPPVLHPCERELQRAEVQRAKQPSDHELQLAKQLIAQEQRRARHLARALAEESGSAPLLQPKGRLRTVKVHRVRVVHPVGHGAQAQAQEARVEMW